MQPGVVETFQRVGVHARLFTESDSSVEVSVAHTSKLFPIHAASISKMLCLWTLFELGHKDLFCKFFLELNLELFIHYIYKFNYFLYLFFSQVAKLTGHSYRVLYLALSPDGEAIVTGAGDETLRFWNVFSKTPSHKENKSVLSLYTALR